MLPALLSFNEAITTLDDRDEVFGFIADKLRELFVFDMCIVLTLNTEQTHTQAFMRSVDISLLDEKQSEPHDDSPARAPSRKQFQTSILQGQTLIPVEDVVGNEMYKRGMATYRIAIQGSPMELFLSNPVPQIVDYTALYPQYPTYPPFLYMEHIGIRQAAVAPLKSLGRMIGLFVLASRTRPEINLKLLEQVAMQLSVAVNNTLVYGELRRREQEATLRLAVNNALVNVKTMQDRDAMFSRIATELKKLIGLDFLGVRVVKASGEMPVFANYRCDEDGVFAPVERQVVHQLSIKSGIFELLQTPRFFVGAAFETFCEQHPIGAYLRDTAGVRSMLYVNIWREQDEVAALVIASGTENAFSEADLTLLSSLAPQIGLAMKNMFAFEEISTLKQQLEEERNYLQEEIKTSSNFEEIIGTSPALMRVLRQVEQVASVDATVLLTGETGTGKELIARAIHNRSPRRDRALIKLNCAALPAQLIESELFGHEKGAFTGASERRIGKFELANGGTIFLDEIGELPLELQAKLLRVLQEREFERLGGSEVLTTNVRVIAATNRNLEREVASGAFRADLYFRLNVFTIQLPSLRERKEDIVMLAEHFTEKYARKIGKVHATGRPFQRIAERDKERLVAYNWSGNIRELENVIERAVIVSNGATLDLSGLGTMEIHEQTNEPINPQLIERTNERASERAMALPSSTTAVVATAAPITTLHDNERQHILRALQQTGGRVSGERGAAALLGINAKTLQSRMKKLGIERTTQWAIP
jgi:transcriptional regulator with GAF, ATPase, and Fis domain